jgi:hypothetical protein
MLSLCPIPIDLINKPAQIETAKTIMLDDLLEICGQTKVETFEILITAEYEKLKQRID